MLAEGIQGDVGLNPFPLQTVAFALGNFDPGRMLFQASVGFMTESCLAAGEKVLLPSRLREEVVQAIPLAQYKELLRESNLNKPVSRGHFILIPILAKVDETTGKLVKQWLSGHPSVARSLTRDPDNVASAVSFLSPEATQGVAWYIAQVFSLESTEPFDPELATSERMDLSLVATLGAPSSGEFTMEPHPEAHASMGVTYSIDYPCETVFIPGSSLWTNLSTAYTRAREKQIASGSSVSSPPGGTTVADAKHMFSTCDGGWSFRQIGDPAKHSTTLRVSLPLIRLIGWTEIGKARHAAFFHSGASYTLDVANIRTSVYSLFSMTFQAQPHWAGASGKHIHEAVKLNAFVDPNKFKALCQLQFRTYDTEEGVSLGLRDFVNMFSFWPYRPDDHDHVYAAIRGLDVSLGVLGGHDSEGTAGLSAVLSLLRNERLNLRRNYDARVLDFSLRLALRRFSVVIREDSVLASLAHVFANLMDTGPSVVRLLSSLMCDQLSEANLDHNAASLDRYLNLEKEEILSATTSGLLMATGSDLSSGHSTLRTAGAGRPSKKQRVGLGAVQVLPPFTSGIVPTSPRRIVPRFSDSEPAITSPCNRDILYYFNVKAKNGIVPHACTSPSCYLKYGHPSRGLFNNWSTAMITEYVASWCHKAVKQSVLTELNSRTVFQNEDG